MIYWFNILTAYADNTNNESVGNNSSGTSDNGYSYQAMYGDEWYNTTEPIPYTTRPEANGPEPIKIEVRVSRNVSIGSDGDRDMQLDFAEVLIDFDQNLFVDDILTRSPIDIFSEQLFVSYGGYSQSTQPKSTSFSKNLVQLKCGERLLKPLAYDDQSNGPNPNGIYVTASVTSPFSSFLMAMNQNMIKEPAIANRFTFLVLLGFNGQVLNKFDFSSCTLKFNNPNSPFQSSQALQKRFVNIPHYIVNKDGTPITQEIQLVAGTEAQCTSSDLNKFYDLALSVIQQFEGKDITQNDFYRIPSVFQGLKANVAYASCLRYVTSLFTKRQEMINVMTSANCQYNQNDTQYLSDPCCNQQLGDTQCCAPRVRLVPFTMVDTFKDQEINKCRSPSKVQSLITSTMEMMRQQSMQSSSYDAQKEYEKYSDFFSTCNDQVYNQDCTSDSQCLSGVCADYNRKCLVPWGKDSTLLLQCYLNQMKPEIFFQIKSELRLPFSNNVTEQDLALIKSDIESKLSDFDCVGNSAYQSGGTKSCDYVQNSDGYFVQQCHPANQDKCLATKSCSLQSYPPYNEDQCNQMKQKQPNFCAKCDYGYCYNVGYPSVCQAYVQSESLCATINGTFTTNNWGYSQCTFSAQTRKDCVGDCKGDYCRSYAYTNDTTMDSCYERQQMRNNNNDSAPSFYWSNYNPDEAPRCEVYYNNNFGDSAFTNALMDGFMINIGKQFQAGFLDTSDTCTSGFCDNRRISTTNKTECENSGYCNRGCSKCVSNNYEKNKQSACIYTTTSNNCTVSSGTYEDGKCLLQGITKEECDLKSGELKTCGDYNQMQCGKDSRTEFMDCKWNQWTDCASKDECEGNGECDDYEFQSDCQMSNSCTPENDGVCLNDFSYANGYKSCPMNSQWSRTGCISKGVKRADCGGIWKKRATTKAECSAHGKGCFEKRYYQYSNKNQTECDKCNGKEVDLYRWSSGIWRNGKMVPGDWKPVAYKTENQFIKVVSRERLQVTIQNSISAIVGAKILNSIKQSFLVPLLAIKQIACSCKSDSDCFSTDTVPLMQCRSDPGIPNDCGVTTNGSSNSSTGTQTGLLTAAGFLGESNQTSFKLVKRLTSSAYAVVVVSGTLVGQLIGDGKSFKFDSPISSFVGCLDVNQQITQDAQYTVYDAVMVLPNGKLSAPLHATITINGLQICGSFTKEGTYFPIKRIENDVQYQKLETSLDSKMMNTDIKSIGASDSTVYLATTTNIQGLGNSGVQMVWGITVVVFLQLFL
eukprot:NODE_58_length_25774_cov_0.240545.p1 type:complete len:1259 gc:universal NODE_58_length_25774_cov_0.240545:7690-11466(+)